MFDDLNLGNFSKALSITGYDQPGATTAPGPTTTTSTPAQGGFFSDPKKLEEMAKAAGGMSDSMPAEDQGEKNQKEAIGKIGAALSAVASFYTGNYAGMAAGIQGMSGGSDEDKERAKASGSTAGAIGGLLGGFMGGGNGP